MQRRIAWWSAILVVSGAISVAGQTYQGGVRGQVRDPQGIIPGAEVTLVNEETNATRTAETNGVGEYAFANVLPATYTLKVAITGFKTEQRKGLRIGTQQFIVEDFMLEVGALEEQITVTGESPLIEASNAAVATSLDSKALEAAPIFGRNPFYLAISTPNVIQTGDPQFVRYQDQTNASYLSLGGGPRRGNGYLLEGVPITDFTNRPTIVPSIEAIEDMKVQVKSYDADMGHSAGGVFNTTAKSGSNNWHGSVVVLNKPQWATGNLYFPKKTGAAKPSQYYYDWGGSLGGPIRKDRTFFFFTTEGYQQKSTRSSQLTFPTALERQGDFSQTVNAAGGRVTIYDPLTTRTDPVTGALVRDPFPGNVIPASRINPIAAAMLKTMPLPTAGKTFGGNAVLVDGPQNQQTIKIDQRWNDKWTTTGMYARQHTREPGSSYFGEFQTVAGDPGSSLLLRTINFGAVNNIWVPNNSTVVAIRFGYNRFFDNGTNYPSFDAASLGFPASYTGALAFNTFPAIVVNGYGGATTMGNNGPSVNTHVSQVVNTTISKVAGHHTMKLGGDYRRIGIDNITYGPSAGTFTFTQGFTQGPNPNTASSSAGDAIASLLLGYPASGSVQYATQNHFYVDYYAGYVQDDFRLSNALTVNYGVRYEYETGLKESNNHLTVGFDRNAPFPVQVPGLTLKGGLMYAGENGYPTQQGHPLHNQIAPRGGIAWSLNAKTVVRGGWGLFWAPQQYPATTEAGLGSRGYSASTTYLASNDGGLTPAGSISNPFPTGITPPQGNSLGLLTGAGGVVDFADQDSKPGYVQQYSLDLQRELPGGNVVTVGYVGSRSERLSIGGTQDSTININQLDPSYFALGAALQQAVPNPMFGNPAFGNFSRSATIARGQLLRPFPQFDNVLAHRSNLASARYNALVVKWDRRLQHGWGVNSNYTYSQLKDNQFGEANFYGNRLGSAENNYDLANEYGYSLNDVPHRLNVGGTVELPFGQGKRWLSKGDGVANALLGGWAVTVVGRFQNGFPAQISQSSNNSGLFGSTQRPNVVPGVDGVNSGSADDNYNRACACIQRLNPAAWTTAPAFTFGNAPRTDPNARTYGQAETDLNIQKMQRIGGKALTVRVDLLNVFDNPLLLGPVTTFGTGNFGQVLTTGGFGRSLQFQFRLAW
jgi:hypothetical protein